MLQFRPSIGAPLHCVRSIRRVRWFRAALVNAYVLRKRTTQTGRGSAGRIDILDNLARDTPVGRSRRAALFVGYASLVGSEIPR